MIKESVLKELERKIKELRKLNMLDFKKSLRVRHLIEFFQGVDPELPVIISESTCNFHNIYICRDNFAIVLVSGDKMEHISEHLAQEKDK